MQDQRKMNNRVVFRWKSSMEFGDHFGILARGLIESRRAVFPINVISMATTWTLKSKTLNFTLFYGKNNKNLEIKRFKLDKIYSFILEKALRIYNLFILAQMFYLNARLTIIKFEASC